MFFFDLWFLHQQVVFFLTIRQPTKWFNKKNIFFFAVMSSLKNNKINWFIAYLYYSLGLHYKTLARGKHLRDSNQDSLLKAQVVTFKSSTDYISAELLAKQY